MSLYARLTYDSIFLLDVHVQGLLDFPFLLMSLGVDEGRGVPLDPMVMGPGMFSNSRVISVSQPSISSVLFNSHFQGTFCFSDVYHAALTWDFIYSVLSLDLFRTWAIVDEGVLQGMLAFVDRAYTIFRA